MPTVASSASYSLAYNTDVLASSSSSINNVDTSDRILVPEPEADVDTVIEQQNAVGQMDATADDEESKESLRAKLRSTLSKRRSLPGTLLVQPRRCFFSCGRSADETGWLILAFVDVGIRQRKKGRSTELSELAAAVRSSVPHL